MRRASSQPPELPGYTFIKLLGSGGFSDVFLYEQALPRRRVAVKVLLTEELSGANRAAFVAEANLMAQLSAHPYIVTIYHADVASDDRPYFVMEYCSGPSLAERYKHETFTVADALRTGVRLSSAVATAHAAGILHRDIKPGNVLGNDYGWPALTDFGISSAVDDDALAVHTTTRAEALEATGTNGQSVGMSVPWSPPEMFEDDPSPDVRSDVFSLAATIYTILAGQTPYEVRGRSNGTLDLIGRIERGAVTPMSRTDVPSSLIAVLIKGMATNREDRFATATDFARALQRVELELGYSATTIDVPNLLLGAPARDRDPGDADETRARSVATVHAQPTATDEGQPDGATVLRSAPVSAADPSSAEPGGDTVVRRRTPVVPEAEQVTAEPEPSPTTARNRVIGWVAGGIAAAIAVALIVSFTMFGPPAEPGPSSPGAADGNSAPIVGDTIPTPEFDGAQVVGNDLVFTIANPAPEEGDLFVWKRSDRGASEPLRSIQGNDVVIEGYEVGSTVCVEVSIRRGSQVSPRPLEQCYPL